MKTQKTKKSKKRVLQLKKLDVISLNQGLSIVGRGCTSGGDAGCHGTVTEQTEY
jgi:hypothetical protein